MRISDWSSDVCSSDLLEQYGFRGALTWLPADRWTVGLLATTQKTHENDLAYTDNYDGQLSHGDSPRPSPAVYSYTLGRSEERRVGKECVSTRISRWSQCH